jgi:hypothetical protein
MGAKIAIPEIMLNTQDFSSVRLPIQSMTYTQRCFRQTLAKLCRLHYLRSARFSFLSEEPKLYRQLLLGSRLFFLLHLNCIGVRLLKEIWGQFKMIY